MEEEKRDEEREEGLDSTRVLQAILIATDFERVTFAAKYVGAWWSAE